MAMIAESETTTADEEEFDEAAYRAVNADVDAAIKAGVVQSGRHHFERHGRREGRLMNVPRSRRDKLLSGLAVGRMRGLEIGPLMTPLVGKGEGDISYVDHSDTETLRAKYACDSGVDLSLIVPVDHVWGAQDLAECIGHRTVDYVLNSHVIEHVPDVVTWLREIHSVLEADGFLRMAIPDRRYTFDFLRTESTLVDALDAHLRRTRVPLPRAILDHFINYAEVDAAAIWAGETDATLVTPVHSAAFALDAAERSYATGDYQDTHCWVFTPVSFARLCAALARLDKLDFVCERIYPTAKDEIEFIVALRPSPDRVARIESWDAAVRQLATD